MSGRVGAPCTPAGDRRRPFRSINVRSGSKPRRLTVEDPGPLSSVKPVKVLSNCVPVATDERWTMDATSTRPDFRLSSMLRTLRGDADVNSLRRRREPVTTTVSSSSRSSSSSSIRSITSSTTSVSGASCAKAGAAASRSPPRMVDCSRRLLSRSVILEPLSVKFAADLPPQLELPLKRDWGIEQQGM